MCPSGIRNLALAALTLCLAAPLRAAELSKAETAKFLDDLRAHRAKNPSLTADFNEEKTTRLLNKPLVTSGTLAFQVPNKFRREIKGKTGSLTVSNGQKLWIHYPSFKEVELYQLGQRPFFDDSIAALTAGLNVQNIAEFYTYKVHAEGDGYRIALTPKSGGLKRMLKELTVWLGSDFEVQRTEALLPKGDRMVTSYRGQRATPLPASTFEFSPPADAHVSEPLGK